ncbi:SCO family protein [Salibacterium aidingense]|uniref:SCO family protein n=1 Tax=Salibacterium aidingense TaxID=384933 RepID=UPI003BC9CBC8
MRLIVSAAGAGLLCMLLSGCAWLYQAGQSQTPENGSDLSQADMELTSFEFTNQDGDTVTNEDLQGNYVLADMIFTSCPTVCNTMTPNMLNLQGEMEKAGIDDIRIVSFTVDPENDDPEALKQYGENYGVDFSNWDFLTGYSDEEIQTLAEKSFKSVVDKDTGDENIVHATTFFLIDPEGNVVRSYDGLENDTDPILEDLKRLKNNE